MIHPEIEKLDAEQIAAIQKEKLEKLGKRLSAIPEWIEHFKQNDMSPKDLSSPDGLTATPFLDKSALRAHYPYPFLSVPMQNVERFMATSGTTGFPVLFGMTHYDWHALLKQQMSRVLAAAGVKPRMIAYQGYGYGLWIGGPALDVGFSALSCPTIPVGPGRGELVAKWMKDHAYEVASMSPLWLMSLVNIAKEAGMNPKTDWNLKLAILGGQSVSAEFRAQLEAELPDGAITQNIYGTTEAGGPVLAISTPESHGMDELQLVNEDTILTEILDPETLKPVSSGEVGEIVITTLEKEASPVVRWRTRDLVRLSTKPYDCPSGRIGMRRIGRIIGRTDDMIKVKGVIVFPSQIEDIIAATLGTAKEAWQIYIDKSSTTISDMMIAVEADKSGRKPAAIEDDIKREIRSRLGIGADVICEASGTLPRYEAKATRVLDKSSRAR